MVSWIGLADRDRLRLGERHGSPRCSRFSSNVGELVEKSDCVVIAPRIVGVWCTCDSCRRPQMANDSVDQQISLTFRCLSILVLNELCINSILRYRIQGALPNGRFSRAGSRRREPVPSGRFRPSGQLDLDRMGPDLSSKAVLRADFSTKAMV